MTETNAAPRATAWQTARVVAIRDETPTAKTFRLALARPIARRAGQHFLLRLTAPDGYTATRSYSVANDPRTTDVIDLTIERLAGGEVSTFLHEEVVVGDELEVRGPIGEWFVWDGDRRALLIGGGSGVVPLAAMLRQSRRTGGDARVHLVVSVRSRADLYYADELPGPDVTVVYTRAAPPGSARPSGRLTARDLPREFLADAATTTYVCGSPGFCDAATDLAIASGIDVASIRVERFGPTG